MKRIYVGIYQNTFVQLLLVKYNNIILDTQVSDKIVAYKQFKKIYYENIKNKK